MKFKNLIFLKLFKEEKLSSFMKKELFIKDLKKNNISDKIFSQLIQEMINELYPTRENFYFSEYPSDFLIKTFFIRDKIIEIIDNKFIWFYESLDEKLKQKINSILFKELNFSNYIDISDTYRSLNKSYEFISISQFLREKILNNKFIIDLENNFGIYLNDKNFIDEIKKKRDTIINDKTNILKNYNIFSITEMIVLLSLEKKPVKKKFNKESLFDFYYKENNFLFKLFKNLTTEEFEKSYKKKEKKKRDNVKTKLRDNKLMLKNSFDKYYYKKNNKFVKKKLLKKY